MNSIDTQIDHVDRHLLALAIGLSLLIWSCLVGFSLYWNIDNVYSEKVSLATAEARATWNKDVAFRRWASRHGGLYVKPDERTPPNPYLSQVPNRDVITTDGTRLTLMNPAYMMRQMIHEFEKEYGVKGNLTAKVLLNPDNKADDWEFRALGRFEQEGSEEIVEEAIIDNEPYLRYMKPMYMTEGCVKCHGILGFKDGDLRGGVSLSIPMQPYLSAAAETTRAMQITHGIVWFIGVASILIFAAVARYRRHERAELLSQMEIKALYDNLTGLPNRLLFKDRLDHVLRKKRRDPDHLYAILFLDLDRFKHLNDSYGHVTGDTLLNEVAGRLLKSVRPGDTVARLGGDEFTVLLDGLTDIREALSIAERLLTALRDPVTIGEYRIITDASIGLCPGDKHYSRPEDLMRDADTAMYRAKSSGKGRVEVFDPAMHEEIMNITAIEHDLNGAVERGELELHYQPVVNDTDGCIEGFEALLRWNHPTRGQIQPSAFIGLSEDTGVISVIGEWVIREACAQVGKWNARYGTAFSVSVNLSARQVLHDDIGVIVSNALRASGLDGHLLQCELTETRLITSRDMARSRLNELRGMGVKLAADDFGTGYCSLTYLQDFHFDVVKIDRQFVKGINHEDKDLKLVRTLLGLALDLGIQSIAEGVETVDQYTRLQFLGCQRMQGYLLCPPLGVEKMEELLGEGCHRDLDLLRRNNPFLREMREAV